MCFCLLRFWLSCQYLPRKARKTPLRKPNRCEATKPKPKCVYDVLGSLYCFIEWGEAGINVHDVLPVTTPRDKQMMPPADRIYDPGQGAKKDLTDAGDDFLAIGPALRIMQLNVEGLSAAKRFSTR